MVHAATVIIPITLVAIWLMGALSLSRGGDRLVELGPKALLAFALILFTAILLLEWSNLTPRWIAGPEGYGIIIPLLSSAASLGLGLLTLLINVFVVRKIAARKAEKEF